MPQTGDRGFNTGAFGNTLQNYTIMVRSSYSHLKMKTEMDCEVSGLEKVERLIEMRGKRLKESLLGTLAEVEVQRRSWEGRGNEPGQQLILLWFCQGR